MFRLLALAILKALERQMANGSPLVSQRAGPRGTKADSSAVRARGGQWKEVKAPSGLYEDFFFSLTRRKSVCNRVSTEALRL